MRAGLVLLAAVAIVAGSHLLGGRRPAAREPAGPVHVAPAVVLASPGAPPPDDQGAREPRSQTAPPPAVRAARRFLQAYLPWSIGEPGDAAALRASSTDRLWRLLRSGRGQPHPRGSIAPAALENLVAGQASTRRAATIIAVLRRARRRSDLALVVHRQGGRWHVSDVGR